MASTEDTLAKAFVCTRCQQRGGHVQQLAMSGTGLSRLLEIQPYRYLFVSCNHCGYTEVYDLDVLRGKDNLGSFLEILFSD